MEIQQKNQGKYLRNLQHILNRDMQKKEKLNIVNGTNVLISLKMNFQLNRGIIGIEQLKYLQNNMESMIQ